MGRTYACQHFLSNKKPPIDYAGVTGTISILEAEIFVHENHPHRTTETRVLFLKQ